MKFFVSWTKREPIFHDYDPSCKILISPAGVPLNWSVSEWKQFPKELFVDSGAYSIRANKIPSCTEVLQRQLSITAKWPKAKKLYFSHPDILIPLNSNFKDQNDIIKFSLERAKEYLALLSKTSSFAIPLGVIHGFDEESIVNSYDFLKSIGYQYFALGSIGIRLTRNKNIGLSAIDVILKYNIKPIHIFGMTLPLDGNNHLSRGIDSFDSSTATKLAFYGTVLYGSPLQRYIISPTAKQKYHDRCFTFRKHLSSPLPCECPVCKIDPNKLLSAYDPNAKFNRILHNYFQIKWEIETQN
jgi:7-cyano-7-deazaguanine tRNA-ribosyltransferase